MKKSWIIIVVIVAVVIAIIGIYFMFKMTTHNECVRLNENVNSQWSNVENVYQRRADLIPNLVATVKGFADHEKETLEGVINARAKATNTNINAGDLSAEKIAAFQQAQDGLSSALSRLMVVVERYPDLKANQNFKDLQTQLEGTENRIAVERRKFNQEVEYYNTYINSYPQLFFVDISRFPIKPYFEAQEGAETAPNVEF